MRIELDLLLDQIRRDDVIRSSSSPGKPQRVLPPTTTCARKRVQLGTLDESISELRRSAPTRELANYFFNDLRHVVIQRAIAKLETLQAVTIAAINRPGRGHRLDSRPPATGCAMPRTSPMLGEVAVPAGFVQNRAAPPDLPKFVGMGRSHGDESPLGRDHRCRRGAAMRLVERVFRMTSCYEGGLRIRRQDRRRHRSCRCDRRRPWCSASGITIAPSEGARAELDAVMEIARAAR